MVVQAVRVIVTGSQKWRDVNTVYRVLAQLPFPSTIIHGCASGLDAIARSCAETLNFEIEDYWPDYVRFDTHKAPKIRNKQMVNAGGDLCLAFPTSTSRGTWHCLNLAKAAGIPWRVYNEGSIEPVDQSP